MLRGMEVHFTADTEQKLKDLAARTGRPTEDLVEDATAAYLDELLQARETLDRRYDELKSGKVQPVPGEEVEAYFRNKNAAARRARSRT
jgi:predicted DNA-binding protein